MNSCAKHPAKHRPLTRLIVPSRWGHLARFNFDRSPHMICSLIDGLTRIPFPCTLFAKVVPQRHAYPPRMFPCYPSETTRYLLLLLRPMILFSILIAWGRNFSGHYSNGGYRKVTISDSFHSLVSENSQALGNRANKRFSGLLVPQ